MADLNHYAKQTAQVSVGILEENGTTFSDQTEPTSFSPSVPNSWFVKNGTVNFGRYYPDQNPEYSEETETDLSI